VSGESPSTTTYAAGWQSKTALICLSSLTPDILAPDPRSRSHRRRVRGGDPITIASPMIIISVAISLVNGRVEFTKDTWEQLVAITQGCRFLSLGIGREKGPRSLNSQLRNPTSLLF
jgi:hypothetical protein